MISWRAGLFAVMLGSVGLACFPADADCEKTATCASEPAGDAGRKADAGDAKNEPDPFDGHTDVSQSQVADGPTIDANVGPDGDGQSFDDASFEAGDAEVRGSEAGADAGRPDGDAARAEADVASGCRQTSECPLGRVCSLVGTCVPGCTAEHACTSGDLCCDATCIHPNDDVLHCGSCTQACSVKNGTPSCQVGMCGVATCLPAFADCNRSYADGCEAPNPGAPTVPVTLQPFAGAYTGSWHAPATFKTLTPKFVWSDASGGACSRTYQIQLDDSCALPNIQACTFPSPEVDQSGLVSTSFTPANPLAVSKVQPTGKRYYWRVRACDQLSQCSAWSRVSYVEVGRLFNDLNGDGYSDVVVGDAAFPVQQAYIYYGGATVDATVDATRVLTRTPVFREPFIVGDLNADGYSDLVLASESNDPTYYVGQMDVFLGGATVPSAPSTPNLTILDSVETLVGYGAGAAGDLDGDGYADFVAGVKVSGVSKLFVYKGGSTVAASSLPLNLGGTPLRMGAAGDMDGDGFSDLVAWAASNGTGSISVYRGGTNPAASPATRLSAFGYTSEQVGPYDGFARGGDMNADGFADLVAVSGDVTTAVLFLGSKSLVADDNTFKNIPAPQRPIMAAGGYDITGDGLPDSLIASDVGVAVLAGGAPLSVPSVLPFLNQPEPGVGFGSAVTMGDYDGDGYGDAFVTNVAAEASQSGTFGRGKAYFMFGGASFPPTRFVVVKRPAADPQSYGYFVN